MHDVLRNASRQLFEGWDVLAPVRCAGCAAPGRQLCHLCRHVLRSRATRSTTLVGTSIPVIYSVSFEGVPGRVITAFKDHGRLALARDLGPLLRGAFDALAEGHEGDLSAVLVPTAPRSTRRRGFSHLEVLMRHARLPAVTVLRSLDRKDQSSLGRIERQRNMRHTMRCETNLLGQAFIIVDDILTSGATIAEAFRAVNAAGGKVLGAAVCARTPLRVSESAVKSAPGP